MQEEYKRVCGNCYNTKYLDYICVDEMGEYYSAKLRHRSVSEAPGASRNASHTISRPAVYLCFYAHLDYNSKLNSAEAMVTGMRAALTTVS